MAKANVTIAISGSYNGRALERARNDLERFNTRAAAEMGGVAGSFSNAGAKLAEFGGHVHNAGSKAQDMGATLTRGVTLPLAGVAAACGAAAIDIDTSLTGVKKTVDGTAEQYDQLKESAIEFSKTNAVSASQILDIQSLGAQLGFTIDELDEFSRVVSGLDIATNMDAETAATNLAQFANITKMAHDEVSNYASAIVGLGNTSATTEADISNMAMRVAAAGTQVGMSQADILGLSAALASMGIEAEAGGTAISTIMSNIDKAVATNSDQLAVWAETAGMSTEEFAAAWKEKPVDALAAVLSNMEAATAEGGNMSLMLEDLGIEGIRQTDVMKRLAGNSDLVTQSVKTANEEWQANTAMQKEVDNRNESMAARFEMLKNRVTAVAEEVGTPLVNAALEFIDAAQPVFEVVENVANGFANMDEESQRLVVGIAAAAAAAGPLLSVGGKALKLMGDVVVKAGGVMQAMGRTSAKAKVGTDEFGRLNGVMGKTDESMGKTRKSSEKLGDTADKPQKSTKGLGDEAKKTGDNMSETAKKTDKTTDSMGKASRAAGGLKGTLGMIGAGLAVEAVIGAITLIATECEKAREKAEELDKATNGLKDSTGKFYESMGNASSKMSEAGSASNDYSESLGNVNARVDDMIAKNAELADSLSGIFSEAGAKVGELDAYRDTIDRFAGRALTNADDVAKLELAVKNLGEATGKSYQVVKEDDGTYQIYADDVRLAKDEVLKLIDAQKQQIYLEANHDAWVETQKTLVENAKTATDAQKKYNEALDHYHQVSEEYSKDPVTWATAMANATTAMNDAKKSADDANETYRAQIDVAKQCEEKQILLQRALDNGADSFEAAIANNSYLMASLDTAGQSALDFTNDLKDLGLSQEDLVAIGENRLPQLAEVYTGSVSSITGKLEEMGIKLDGGKLKAKDMAEQMEAHIGTLDADMQAKLENCGVSLSGLCLNLANAGISVEQLKTLTNEQLLELAQDYANGNTDIKGKLDTFVEQNRAAGINGGDAIKSKFEGVLEAMKPATERKTKQISRTAKLGLGDADATPTGRHFVQGFINGMGGVNLWRKAWDIGKAALDGLMKSLGCASPSKETMKVGEYAGMGAVIGMESTRRDIEREADRLGEAMVMEPPSPLKLSPRAYSGDYTYGAQQPAYKGSEAVRNITINLSVNVTAGSEAEAATYGKTLGEQLYTEFVRRERAMA